MFALYFVVSDTIRDVTNTNQARQCLGLEYRITGRNLFSGTCESGRHFLCETGKEKILCTRISKCKAVCGNDTSSAYYAISLTLVLPSDQPTECTLTQRGQEYLGVISQSRTNTACERWSDQPEQLLSDYDFGSETVEEAQNYCRNPNGDSAGLWCFTTGTTGTHQYCSQIPKCGKY